MIIFYFEWSHRVTNNDGFQGSQFVADIILLINGFKYSGLVDSQQLSLFHVFIYLSIALSQFSVSGWAVCD